MEKYATVKIKIIYVLAIALEIIQYTFALPKFSKHADVAKLVDALDLGSSAARHGGSSPSIRTINHPLPN